MKYFKSIIQLLFFLHLIFPTAVLFSQNDLFIPLELSESYKNQTRSPDGRPGKYYWQNRVDYKIKVDIDPENQRLSGQEIVNYTNNSPDSLTRIVLRLYQDRYKIGNMRDFPVDSADVHSGVRLFKLQIDGTDYPLSGPESAISHKGTVMTIELDHPISPKTSQFIEISWQTRLPEHSRPSRMGAEGDSAMFVAYWFPEIAVYDDTDGWDRHSHTGSQEFYREFGDFEVEISVPGDDFVWATGLLQNAEQVLPEKIFERYQKSFETDDIIAVVSKADYEDGTLFASGGRKTWRFSASNVPDFAFAVSNCHLWDATSLRVDQETDRRVMIEAVYMQGSEALNELADIARKTINYLSFELPGVPFPYPQFTVFNSHISGGMEFPMMANDATTRTRARTIDLTSHEITHTYFPFFMGTNETKYAWMDEGMAVMLPLDFQTRESKGYDRLAREIKYYELAAGREMDLPLMTPSVMLRGPALRTASYGRPAIAYTILREIMGEEKFKQALRIYMDVWKGKHPLPYDFFFIFNIVNDENLDWFWKPWFFERGYPDVGISKISNRGNLTEVTIEMVGSLPIPVQLKAFFVDSTEQIIRKPASIWKDGNKVCKVQFEHQVGLRHLTLGDRYIPDRNKDNNRYVVDKPDE